MFPPMIINDLSFSPGAEPTPTLLSKINGNNYSDFVFVNYGADSVDIVFTTTNDELYSLKSYPTEPDSRPIFVSVADVNQDDKLDIIVANSNTNNVGVLLNYGNEKFGPQTTYSTGDNSNPRCVSISDLNGDSYPEIIVANHNSHNVGILVNYGNGTFSLQKTYSTGPISYPRFVSVIDVNDDNRPDIIVANSMTNNVGVMLAV